MKTISRYIMTLALLLTAVTGAWAQSSLNVVEFAVPDSWAGDKTAFTAADFPADFVDYSTLTDDEAKALLNSVPTGNVIIFYGAGASSNTIKFVQHFGDDIDVGDNPVTHDDVFYINNYFKFYYTAEPAITVTWNASTKTGTFEMPGSDVVLTPIYAKAATFATTGTEPEVKTLLPEAAEGIIAGTDASLIAEGTGIVAFAGTSTEVTQGTLMYAIGTSDTQAPALDDFSATAPTAKNIADDGATLYVWYYIKGADAPEGQQATEDNTFDDTEPACLTVTVLTNKFDITFNAANANTIEAGKATVTVDGAAATVTDGKLKGVKMGSEVKLEANPGYKFRKVEVKKGGAGRPAAEATADDKGKLIGADGNIYDDAAAATAAGTTAVAKIIYLGSETGDATYTHGLALALADEGEMTWATAVGTCSGKNTSATVPGASWMLPSQVQWNKMISAAGSYTALRDGFSSVDGTNMSSYYYWSSTEIDSDRVYYIYFGNGNWGGGNKGYSDVRTRAVLAF